MKLNGRLSYLLYAASIALGAPIEKRTSYDGGPFQIINVLFRQC